MNTTILNRLRALVESLGAQSVSIGTGPEHLALTCLPTRMEAFLEMPDVAKRVLGSEFLSANACESLQILWAGLQGMGRTSCTLSSLGWTPVETIPGAYNPVFSLIITGKGLEAGAWVYAFDVSACTLNCSPVGSGLHFEAAGAQGVIVHDEERDTLLLANAGSLLSFREICHLVIWTRGRVQIPDPENFHRELVKSMREKYLKTDRDFLTGELSQAVDMEPLRNTARHPQDLAALLGLGLVLKPDLERSDPTWQVERYLLSPVVLEGYDATACVEAGLPISPEGLAPDWALQLVPSIREALPNKAMRKSPELGIYLVNDLQAGALALPYLLVQPGGKLLAGSVLQSPERPLLLLARLGRKASGIAGDLAGRGLFLGFMLRQFGVTRELEYSRILLERVPFKFDPILAALWLVSRAGNLTRGEASSLGHLKRSAHRVSLATAAEIEAVRKKKPDALADQALAQALEALRAKREKLLGSLSKAARVKGTP
jgi:hypothetical protein